MDINILANWIKETNTTVTLKTDGRMYLAKITNKTGAYKIDTHERLEDALAKAIGRYENAKTDE